MRPSIIATAGLISPGAIVIAQFFQPWEMYWLTHKQFHFPFPPLSSVSGECVEDDSVNLNQDHVADHDHESDREGEKSTTLYAEYVALCGCSLHKDCPATLKKCHVLLGMIKQLN